MTINVAVVYKIVRFVKIKMNVKLATVGKYFYNKHCYNKCPVSTIDINNDNICH